MRRPVAIFDGFASNVGFKLPFLAGTLAMGSRLTEIFDFTAVAAMGDEMVDFNDGDHFLNRLLLVDGESKLERAEYTVRAVTDVGDETICEVLDALFRMRCVIEATELRWAGISMFVLHLTTFLDDCSETVRLNGILETRGLDLAGEAGSDTMTGTSPSDGSSLVNVFCRIKCSVLPDSVDCCRPKSGFSLFFGEVFMSFDVNVGRYRFNDSALRWINDFALLSILGVLVSILGVFASALSVLPSTALFGGDFGVITFAGALIICGATGAVTFVNFAMEYGETYAGFLRPRIALGSFAGLQVSGDLLASGPSATYSVGLTIRGDFDAFPFGLYDSLLTYVSSIGRLS